MKREKIVGIFVCSLLIATTFPAVGIETNNEFTSKDLEDYNKEKFSEINPPQASPIFWHIDQKQTKNCGSGWVIAPPFWWAQEFKPSKEKLIGVELWMFKHEKPPAGLKITVSIRDSLNGSDLTATTLDADPIKAYPGTWLLFDFDDITVTPENTYYIVCRGGGGENSNFYCWFFNTNNSYDRGIAWRSEDNGSTWYDLENYPGFPKVDCCFKTYNSKPKTKTFNFDQLSWLFERFPNVFPILRHLIGLY